MGNTPRFGVNYVPGTGWWYSWVDWNDDAIVADLAAIASLGADHIRIHCLWPLFQPNPSRVSKSMLDRLSRLFEIADVAGLDVIVTVFNGWLSGFDFRPSWVADGVNIFTERSVVEAELALLAEIAGAVGGHPRFLGFDVANEPSVLETDDKNVTTSEEADAWVTRLLTSCAVLVPEGFHSVGMDHGPWLTADSAFSRETLARTGSVTPIHAWTFFTGALERYGSTGTGTRHLTEYMLELAKAYSVDPRRPVWLQEYGVSTEWMDAADRDGYLIAATRTSASVEGLWGITWWCSHDIDRGLTGFHELEYDLGLLTVDNEVKSLGHRFREVIAELRNAAASPVVARTTAILLPDGRTPDLDFADAFFSLIDRGVRPAIVLSSRAADRDYLSGRGIDTLVEAIDS